MLDGTYICDRVYENRSYLHKIHLFIYHIYLFFCVGYTISVSFIKFLRKFCVYDDKVLCYEKDLLNLKGSELGQILPADKTGFRTDLITYIGQTLPFFTTTWYKLYSPQ